ncbi:MAG TPA: GTP-binding protein [Crenotrichaceae bacterium]|nr:GTP-binding protein [Crenotrichaceae bacterium]
MSKKICLLGDFAIGKTSLTMRFSRQTFSDKYLTTVGVKIDSKLVDIPDHQTIKLVIWDIAGSDAFTTTDENYLRGAAGVLLVADGCRKNTLSSVMNLRQIVLDVVGDCPMVVAVNKVDLKSQWEVDRSDIIKLQKKGLIIYKTSAKTGENVDVVFNQLASLLIAR